MTYIHVALSYMRILVQLKEKKMLFQSFLYLYLSGMDQNTKVPKKKIAMYPSSFPGRAVLF